ncbi:leucine-rich repeat extensin-like protein 3 [Melia azedarach]|uniref:Leucine-rich repeat extensin-like protein 3 n=1 Tax=Melia azedarach TaxID=155640 RepID=A0ACC1YQH9_MELAZ|nr:leucine-rich repeat extensin-like protein 3 [Melia azedarach]
MVSANLVFLLALSPLLFYLDFASSRQVSKNDALPSQLACVNCTICPYPCHNLPPSSPSGYPLYGAPPPPVSGYPSYGGPPPPLAQGNCPPVPVQCCNHVPPPNTYTYLPSANFSPFPYPTSSFISILILLASFAALF